LSGLFVRPRYTTPPISPKTLVDDRVIQPALWLSDDNDSELMIFGGIPVALRHANIPDVSGTGCSLQSCTADLEHPRGRKKRLKN
jgi:hypothetical protein